MEKDAALPTPTVVSHDGWTLASGSSDHPTESQLKQSLGASADAAVDTPPAPAPVPLDTPPAPVEFKPAGTIEQPAEPTPEPEPPVATTPETPAAPKSEKRKTHDPQRRIDQQHAAKEQAEALLTAERDRTARLERELAEIRAKYTPPVVAAPAPAPTAPVVESKPKPIWEGPDGYEAQGKTWEAFHADETAWLREDMQAHFTRTMDERLKAERAQFDTATKEAEERRQRDADELAFTARVEAHRALHPDYDEKIEALGHLQSAALGHILRYSQQGPAIAYHLGQHLDEADVLVGLKYTRPIVDALMRTNAPVKVLSHLAQHPEEFTRLAQLDAVGAIVSIGRLEARLDVAPAVTTAAAPSPTQTRPPLRTVNGGAVTTRTTPDADLDSMPFSVDYVTRANRLEREAEARRRGY